AVGGGGGTPTPPTNRGGGTAGGWPVGGARAGPPARRVDACLSRCAARALLAATVALPLLASNVAAAPRAVVLEIDGAIGPAVADYVARERRGVGQSRTRPGILRVNTPGGLDTALRTHTRALPSPPVPVAAYVAPSGARAASAGTYITYASAIAAMAPGTNLGAATPIQMGRVPRLPGGAPEQPAGQKSKDKGSEGNTSSAAEPADTETRKAVNDAVAYIRGLAELNDRNADWAAEAVRTAVSLPPSEALKLHLIDRIARD